MSLPSLGIDMSQRTFDAALWVNNTRLFQASFDNSVAGYRRLERLLKTHGYGKVQVAIEATNVYAEALLQWLYERGHTVYLLNPSQVHHYAYTLGQRNKTDSADAVTIARFIAGHEATPWHPPAPEQRALRSLLRTRQQLVQLQLQLTNQLRTAEPIARPYLQATLQALRAQLAELQRQLQAHLKEHPLLADQVRRLMTMSGVGLLTAAIVVAELPAIDARSDPRALCAWAGVIPCRRQSGQRERVTRLSRRGNSYLRQALYMPALVAKRYNPQLKAFGQRLADAGKSQRAILGAIAHKMLRILIGLLRTQTDYDPNWTSKKTV